MEKEAYDPFSMLGTFGMEEPGAGLASLRDPRKILQYIKQDHGLEQPKKKSLMTMLNSPEAFDHVFVGVTGMAVAKAVANYSNMSKPAQTLLSLAGFGIGNIIYNTLNENKFTSYDKHTGIVKIKT